MENQIKAAGFLNNKFVLGTAILLFVVGVIGLLQRFLYGHLPAGYGSFIPWGLWVAMYFHGVGIAGGAFVIGVWLNIFNFSVAKDIRFLRTVIVLSAASILPSLLAVGLDLGHMERAYRIYLSPNFTSMMAFNAWMYVAFLIFCAIAYLLTYKNDSGWLKPLLIFASIISIAFPSQSGAFFGVVEAKPFWHSALLPVLFLTSAIVAGSSILLIISNWFAFKYQIQYEEYKKLENILRIIIIISITFYFIFEWAEFSISIWNPEIENEAINLILFGSYSWIFWGVHILLGGIIPYIMLLSSKKELYPWAALFVAISFISTRLNILLPGQAVGELKGLQQAFSHPRLSYIYHPTLMEYSVGAFLVFMAIAIFYLGIQVNSYLEKYSGGNQNE